MPTTTARLPKTVQLKKLLVRTYLSNRLDEVNDFIDSLPRGSRFIVRPRKMTPIIITGWDQKLGGVEIAVRGRLVEITHTFPGIGFFFDKEGYLSLLGGDKPHQPWARLPFGHIDNQAAFDLAILEPATPSHLAEYI